MRIRRDLIGLLLLLSAVSGCTTHVREDGTVSMGSEKKARASPATEKKTPQLEITVTAANTVLVEGESITLDQLATRLDETKASGESVWYYRENPAGQAPPITKDVLQLVMDRGLALSMSSEPDFSTWIDEAGNARRR